MVDTDEVPAFAEAEFSKGGDLDNRLIQLVVSYASSREAESAFEDIQQRAQECSTWEDNDAESEATYSLRGLSFPRLGDETIALRMSGEITSLPDPNEEFSFDFSATVEADLIVVQEGNLVMIVSQLAVGFLGPLRSIPRRRRRLPAPQWSVSRRCREPIVVEADQAGDL